jgi:hypothetical protein
MNLNFIFDGHGAFKILKTGIKQIQTVHKNSTRTSHQTPCSLIMETNRKLTRTNRATRYGLDGPGIESQCEARLSVPFQTCPRVHPASYTMGTGSFPGGKVAGAWR